LGENGNIRLNGIKPQVDEQGNICEQDNVIGKLKLVTFKPGAQLNDIGNGLYMINGDSSVDSSATPKVRQGYQEVSNVVIMDEMVKMIETMRHFEASQHFMQGYDEMLDKAINVVGEV